ncbi:MAG TPA: hypothetical protein VGI03_02035 [Verrucomicrobiae bacterium]|jgi:hypothetical protein
MSQFKKSQVRIDFTNLEADRTTVERVLLETATKFNLTDNSHTSRIPHTIKSIIQPNGFGSGGRVVANSIYVDFNPGKNKSSQFDEVHDFIISELQNAFQCELQEIWEDDPAHYKTH